MSNTPSRGSDGTTRPPRALPERPSIWHLRRPAKDLLLDVRTGDAGAIARITIERNVSPARIALSDAQLAITREFGFKSWPKLAYHVETVTGGGFVLQPPIRPIELTAGRSCNAGDGTSALHYLRPPLT